MLDGSGCGRGDEFDAPTVRPAVPTSAGRRPAALDFADLSTLVAAVRRVELPLLFDIAKACLEPRYKAPVPRSASPPDALTSVGAKALFLAFSQLAQQAGSSSPVARTDAIRLLLHARELLRARLITIEEREPAASAEPETADADDAPEHICVLYQRLEYQISADRAIATGRSISFGRLSFLPFRKRLPSLRQARTRLALLPGFSDDKWGRLRYKLFLYASEKRSIIKNRQHALVGRLKRRLNRLRGTRRSASNSTAKSEPPSAPRAHPCRIMGTFQMVTVDDWNARAEDLAAMQSHGDGERRPPARFHIAKPYKLITAIASLYKAGDYVETFLENICDQSIFADGCELIIIDADSPENEAAIIERYTKRHRNITYRRMDHRIGVYDAWNLAVEMSRGEYLTTTNLDDLRRHDSFELQAEALEALPFVDVVYQDFYYSFDATLGFDEAAAFGYKSKLPVVTPQNLILFNSPHNAPMWRKALHNELGGFDPSLTSAGDWEFWLRCLAAGKTFYKLNAPHIVYFQNPDGVSTRPGTRGLEEGVRVQKQYAGKLISNHLICEQSMFRRRLGVGSEGGDSDDGHSRYDQAQTALRKLAVHSKLAAQSWPEQCGCS
ncbi:MAG: glycosyltransferase [Nitrosospira sp.]|nr:glycosyltransferase [Nitrosospira sp.]